MQCSCAIMSSVACPLYNIFPHYLINGTFFYKTFLNIKYVFRFSLHLLPETFFTLRRTEWDTIKNIYLVSTESTLYCCPISINLGFSQSFFEKFSNVTFIESLSGGSRVVPCGQTDGWTEMTKLIVALRNFANALNKYSHLQNSEASQKLYNNYL